MLIVERFNSIVEIPIIPPQNSGDSAAVLNPLIHSVGALLVEVDPEDRNGRPDSNGGKAWMRSFNHENGRGTVSYIIDGRMSLDIEPGRLHQASLTTFARRNRKNESDGSRPSILTPAHRENHLRSQSNNNHTNRHGTQQFGIVNVFAKSRHWDSSRNSRQKHPLLKYLQDGKKTKEKGWLRLQEAQVANRPEPKQNSHLNTPERELVVPVRTIITSVPKDRRPKRSRPNSDLAFAFGKTQKTIRNINKRVLEHNNNPKYQQRSDAGITVFDTVKKNRQFSLCCIIIKSGND